MRPALSPFLSVLLLFLLPAAGAAQDAPTADRNSGIVKANTWPEERETAQRAEPADAFPALDTGLQALATEFFAWRAGQQPAGGDAVARVERQSGWLPAWSAEDLAIYRYQYKQYLERLQALDRSGFTRADEVDAMLLESVIKRVGWELDVLRAPHRNPLFYVDQTLGPVFELLVLSSPVTPARVDAITARLGHFPVTVAQAKDNLGEPAQPFAVAAVNRLTGIEEKLAAMRAGLEPLVPADRQEALATATETASAALGDYRTWLQRNLATMSPDFAIGRDAYQWYLAHVALIPHTPEELLAQGRQAWHRAVVSDLLQAHRNRDVPEPPLFETVGDQVRAAQQHELEIRAFLEARDLVTVPDWLMHYGHRPLPGYLEPLAFLGLAVDFTAPGRLDEDAVGYLPPPAPDLPFNYLASAHDPRPEIVRNGVPGHYFQLALSWANPDPVRRHHVASSANDGIALYALELLLQSGLWDFSPRTKEIVSGFMRLGALQVEVDLLLATGEVTITEAGDYLARTVPLDLATAAAVAERSATSPGEAIGSQIGALQILEFLAAARLARGEDFSLRDFHDRLVRNGNVPIALQRWEYLDHAEGVERLRAFQGRRATVPR